MAKGNSGALKDYWKNMTPEERERRKALLKITIQKRVDRCKERRELRFEKLANYIALNPLSGPKEACKAMNVPYNPTYRQQIMNIMASPAFKERILAYKQEFVNPTVVADISERYRTLALQAVDKAQQRLMAKDCKDQTLVEILRVCGQYLAPKNAAVHINAGQGSLVGILSDLQSSAQESLSRLPINGVPVLEQKSE